MSSNSERSENEGSISSRESEGSVSGSESDWSEGSITDSEKSVTSSKQESLMIDILVQFFGYTPGKQDAILKGLLTLAKDSSETEGISSQKPIVL